MFRREKHNQRAVSTTKQRTNHTNVIQICLQRHTDDVLPASPVALCPRPSPALETDIKVFASKRQHRVQPVLIPHIVESYSSVYEVVVSALDNIEMSAEQFDGLARPLLLDESENDVEDDGDYYPPLDLNTSSASQSISISDVGGLEEHQSTPSSKKKRISTWALILTPIAILIPAIFLAAKFLPSPQHEGKLHDDRTVPTLLAIVDGGGKRVNSMNNELYQRLKGATFHGTLSTSSGLTNEFVINSNKKEVKFGEDLTLSWSLGSSKTDEDDILALYCPANESDPKKFKDVATLTQVRATHNHHQNKYSTTKVFFQSETESKWFIPSFPIIREESCEFRMYSHSMNDNIGHYYQLLSKSSPISLTSSQQTPTGIHVSLTGNPTEMKIQFATGGSGQPVVEIAPKTALKNVVSLEDGETLRAVLVLNSLYSSEVDWTKLDGVSTTYLATDMCQGTCRSYLSRKLICSCLMHRLARTISVLTDVYHRTRHFYRSRTLRITRSTAHCQGFRIEVQHRVCLSCRSWCRAGDALE